MSSLISETLSLDDYPRMRETMRPPLVWHLVWTHRALQAWDDRDSVRSLLDSLEMIMPVQEERPPLLG